MSQPPAGLQAGLPPLRRALGALAHEARLALIALQFLTRVPVPARVGFEPAWLHASARYFPLVGLFVGAVGALVLWLAAALWPVPVAAGLSIAATVWLTGGFHEDGLADTCDGLGGSVSRERALQIMKDSRLGSYGALGLMLVLGLKAAALASLAEAGIANALTATTLAHGASRAAAVALLRVLPYAGDVEHAKAKPMAQQVSRVGVAVACAWPLLAALALGGLQLAPWRAIFAALAAAAVSAALCARWFRRRLAGYTGDTLGGAQQFSELAMLLAWQACVMH